jgi:hypothetical protein
VQKQIKVIISPAGVGFCAVLVAFYVSFYYNVIIGWALYFLVASATPELPWLHCNNTWNTESCTESQLNASNNGSANSSVDTPGPSVGSVAAGGDVGKLHFSPASEYFQ